MDKNHFYSVGQLAGLSGTTIRTLQYYDKIGLLPAKRNKDSQLRYYDHSDLLTLQQILFYKKLGVPLKEIKHHLSVALNSSDTKSILQKQADILLQQEMEVKMNHAIIEAVIASLDANPQADLEPMMKIILGLNKQSIFEYETVEFDSSATSKLEEKYANFNDLFDMYWKWKQLVLEAVSYKLNAVSPKSDIGYQFGQKWEGFTSETTGEDPEMTQAFLQSEEQKEQWPDEDLFLYNFSNDFIDTAYTHYHQTKDEKSDPT